ncbi:MAG TPA: hypothetical protein DHW39_03775 [Erysipelotrichaceae bacterium]|nr:hypothetical protein [Erysipelotrichaceae bacterium]
MMKWVLTACGMFYELLCVFSLVTGYKYWKGMLELNPLELPDSFDQKLSDPKERKAFAEKMGKVTMAVGVAQGIAALCILKGSTPLPYFIALGFTIFSICSVAYKLKGKISTFAVLKAIAYTAILIALLLPGARAAFF